jgi:hypothetical protein
MDGPPASPVPHPSQARWMGHPPRLYPTHRRSAMDGPPASDAEGACRFGRPRVRSETHSAGSVWRKH